MYTLGGFGSHLEREGSVTIKSIRFGTTKPFGIRILYMENE